MIKAGLERLSQSLAMELQDANISVNVLSPQGRIKTPGNLFAENDPNNPSLEFERTGLTWRKARADLRAGRRVHRQHTLR